MSTEVITDWIKAPQWMDAEYFTQALRQGLESPELQIISLQLKPATAAGDNYASQIFRATLELKKTPGGPTEPLSVVLKTTHQSDEDMVQKMNLIWDKEANIMMNILPKMHDILKTVYDDQEPFGAKCIWQGVKPASVIMIEDLRVFGFHNADRMEGLDKATTRVVLESLAKFHASSIALYQRDPKSIQDVLQNPWDDTFQQYMETMLNQHIKDFLEEVSTWEEIPEQTLHRLKTLSNNPMEKLNDSVQIRDDFIKVLLHGDCWINNFMFSKETEKELSFRFVDFQLGHYNSPVLDLIYFLFSSPSANIRISTLQENLQFYYENFVEIAKNLDVELPNTYTFSKLLQEFKDRLFFSIFALLITYPITVCPAKDAPDFNDFFQESSKRFLYQSKKFREVFNVCLPYLSENSLF